ncbi:hypothetical protein DQ04_04691050 [Trypanosoma grayi]|uniref:hypothetical protein n=1 Tax=Trypanosoma grayi TaxID=71804 RepID=UPI0004F4264F|nr:hypothetical protein DQ04_04691050 [Trypanosoma grayi]KEG09768.1 hypothetical protein DQ04_04691050 [Trypanosoma grayi]
MPSEEYWIRSAHMNHQSDVLSSVGGNGVSHSRRRQPFDEISVNLTKDELLLGGRGGVGMNTNCASSDLLKAQRYDPLWQPTRLTSPYCVLSANGVQDDFYTSCLSWGRENVALALCDEVLLFQPSRPLELPAVMNLQERSRGSVSKVTSVGISQFSDCSCFLGELDGSVSLCESRGDGLLTPVSSFAMPPPPLENTPLSGAAAMAVTSSVQCLATANAHPWMVAAGTAAQGLFILDSRSVKPVAHMGGCDLLLPSAGKGVGAQLSPGDAVSLLSSANSICGVSWNASGSLVATGESGGVVNIWSLSHTRAPVHRMKLPGVHTTIKAVAFHPTNPYELVVGGGTNDGMLRVYDVSSAASHLAWGVSTGCQVTQALYSPDGAFIVSAQGAHTGDSIRARSPSIRLRRSIGRGGETHERAADQVEQLTEMFERGMSRNDHTLHDAGERSSAFSEVASSEGNDVPSISEALPFSLVMWRKGTQRRGSTPVVFANTDASATRQGRYYSPESRHTPLPLVSMYVMAGHRSRPLHMTAPFLQASNPGCVASVAGGADSTIRFWRCFCSKSEAVNWEQRARASLRAAITDDDVEGVMALPLR